MTASSMKVTKLRQPGRKLLALVLGLQVRDGIDAGCLLHELHHERSLHADQRGELLVLENGLSLFEKSRRSFSRVG